MSVNFYFIIEKYLEQINRHPFAVTQVLMQDWVKEVIQAFQDLQVYLGNLYESGKKEFLLFILILFYFYTTDTN